MMIRFLAGMAALAAFVSANPLANQDPRIVNGIPTTAEDYPFIVDLRMDWVQIIIATNGTLSSEFDVAQVAANLKGCTILNTSETSWHCVSDSFCTGSLIQKSWPATILTAAHCLDPDTEAKYYGVFLGRTDADAEYDETSNAYQYYANWRMWIHENYNATTLENDIALMFLDDDLSDDDSLDVVTLNQNTDLLSAGDGLIVIGYGHDAYGGVPTDTLEYVGQYFVNDSMCEFLWSTLEGYANWILEDRNGMMCALGDGTDSYQGDSGGPLISDSSTQVGVTSYGSGCASGIPGVYADVANYYGWIVERMDVAEWAFLSKWTPTSDPTTLNPTLAPTSDPTLYPTVDPTLAPTSDPTSDPTLAPTSDPTSDPTLAPTSDPTTFPTIYPTTSTTTSTPSSVNSADDAAKSEDSFLDRVGDQDWILLALVIAIVFLLGALVGVLFCKSKANRSPKEEPAQTRGMQLNSMSMDTAVGAA